MSIDNGSITRDNRGVIGNPTATDHSIIFDELYKYRPGVFTRLLRLTNDYELAEDLCQEVFLKVWRYLPKLQHERAMWGLLKLVTQQVYMDYSRFRREKLLICSLEYVDLEGDCASARHDPDRSYGDCELMRQALATCSEQARKALVGFYIYGEKAADMHDVYEARRLLNQRYKRLLKREAAA